MFQSTLITLNLEVNSISSEGIGCLSEGLKVNTILRTLKLGRNKLGVEGAKHLALCLGENSTLTMLSLGANNIRAEGACALAQGLQTNKGIVELRLGGNDIQDQGAQAFTKMLQFNQKLEILHLYGNNISQGGVKAVGDFVMNTPSTLRVKVLNLGGNDCDSAAWVHVGCLVRLHLTPEFKHRIMMMALLLRTLPPVSYTHLRAHETPEHLVCRLLLEKKKNNHHIHF
eukprot:TRINITY_DN9659_c0_g1_i2.p2 TRINITY_DN9659_c0_g1~~TRINITY_DN9659_c0_g1_i2.p2  ORF type:complete len:228 (-),score=38.33 TRINITY_DN9659_c0_g1_i2:53-736(-)